MSQSLEDIARLAGVSRSTVSRVINNHPNVKERTRRKVMQVIEEQRFRPNLAARALVTQQTRILSLVIPRSIADTFADPYFPTLIQGVIHKANQCDYATMLWMGSSDEEESRFYQRVLGNSLCDGIIVSSAVIDDPLIPRLAESGFPFVVIGPPPLDGLNSIDIDNTRAAQIATAHLIRLGYQRIGTITGPLNTGPGQDRLKGYRQALERAGRSVNNDWIVEGNFLELSGYLGMQALLQQRVDAVFAASDVMATGAMRAIFERGLRVPDDIAIVGFDDTPFAATMTPRLTTINQPIRELGVMAAQVLIDLLSGTLKPPYKLTLPAQLVVRDTCGATRL